MNSISININKITQRVNDAEIRFITENKTDIEWLVAKMLHDKCSVRYGTISVLGAITIYSTGYLKIEQNKFKYEAVFKDFSIPPIYSPSSVINFGLAHIKAIKDIEIAFEQICNTGIYNATLLNDFYAVRIDINGKLNSYCFVLQESLPNSISTCESSDLAEIFRWAVTIAMWGLYE